MRHKRSRRKIKGIPERPRMCVFISNRHVYSQIIDDVAGRTIVSACTLQEPLKAEVAGKNKKQIAAIIGGRIAELAKEAGVTKVVFDKSGYRYSGRLSAMADAARKGGLEF